MGKKKQNTAYNSHIKLIYYIMLAHNGRSANTYSPGVIVSVFSSINVVFPGYLTPSTKCASSLFPVICWFMLRYEKQSLLLKEIKENEQGKVALLNLNA